MVTISMMPTDLKVNRFITIIQNLEVKDISYVTMSLYPDVIQYTGVVKVKALVWIELMFFVFFTFHFICRDKISVTEIWITCMKVYCIHGWNCIMYDLADAICPNTIFICERTLLSEQYFTWEFGTCLSSFYIVTANTFTMCSL